MGGNAVAGDGLLGGFIGTLSYLLTWVLMFAAAIVAMVALYIYLPLRKQESYRYYAAELSCVTGSGLFLLLQFVLVGTLQPLPTLAFLLVLIPIGVKTLFSSVKDAVRCGADSDSNSGSTVAIVSSSSSEEEGQNNAAGDVLLIRSGKDRVRGLSAIRVNPTSGVGTFGEPQSCVAVLTSLSKFQSGGSGLEWVFKIDVDPSSSAANYSFIAVTSGKVKRSGRGDGVEQNDVVNLVRRATLYLRSALLSVGFTSDDAAPMPGVELLKSLSSCEGSHSAGSVMVGVRGLPEKVIATEDLEISSYQKQRLMSRSSSSSSFSSSSSLFHPVGRLVRFMVSENIGGSYVVRFRRTRPPEGVEVLDSRMVEAMNGGGTRGVRGPESSQLLRLRSSVAGRLRLADGEELADEVMAGVRRGYWGVESCVVMAEDDDNGDSVVKISSTIVSCFSGGMRSVDTATLPVQSSSSDYGMVSGLHSFMGDLGFRSFTGEMSSDSLASFITLSPPYPVSSCEASLSAEFEMPTNGDSSGNGLLHLGRAYFRGTLVGDVKIKIEDLSMHLAVLGETGIGKTRFVADWVRQLWDLDPTINWLIVDLKGEYYDQLQQHIGERIEVLKAGGDINGLRQGIGDVGGVPLRIDLLNDGHYNQSDRRDESVVSERTGRLLSALKESLAGLFKENTEFSPMMERILFESLKQVMATAGNLGDSTEGDTSGGGFFDALFHEVESYVTGHKRRDIVMSGEALKNRLERFRRGAIGDILNHNYRNDKAKGCFPSPDFREMIRTKKLIIDLSGCVRKGCSKEDIRLLLNLITSVIFEEALKRGLVSAPALRHLTVIEEANLLAPDILRRKTMGDLTSTEDMILTARGFGEGLILVAQRPTVSSFILANAGTKVVFRSPYDAARVAKFMGLNEEQENAVKSLRKFEALVTTVQGGPYRISTTRSQQPATPPSHPRRQQQKPDSSSLLAHVASKSPVIEATEDENSSVEDDDGDDTNYGGQGGVMVYDGDVKRLLKRRGISSDRFKLFGTVASSSSHVKVSDAILGVFGGEEQRYLDALGNLTDTAVWRKPLVTVDDCTIRLTEYGREVWNAIQQDKKKRRRGISG